VSTATRTLLLAQLLVSPSVAMAAQGTSACLTCHEEQVPGQRYDVSVHADLTCTACHQKDDSQAAPTSGDQQCAAAFVSTECARCHEKEAEQHEGSIHNSERLPAGCVGCHSDIHTLKSHKGDKLRTAETCAGCHSRQAPYFASTHYAALKEGHFDAPTCTDCHATHTVAKIDNDEKGRAFHTMACLKCHDDREKMEKNEVTWIAGETFFQSFHGKNVRLGYPEKVAGCADCHRSHEVRKAEDPESSVSPNHLVATCGQCHAGATSSFVEFIPHAEDGDRVKSPALYWTRIGMTSLLVGTFFFFWVHSALWALRAFIERRNNPTPPVPRPSAHGKTYRRFTPVQIGLHLVVVVSFLALAFTGLPLKFSGTGWGHTLMGWVGGPDRARAIHHSAAVITFGYFIVALGMSFRFLFDRQRPGGSWWARLWGPDSLFPNLRDLRDIIAMFRWFTFRGPRPSFDRWTYWEKFDFLAVFWGMFAIGLSGLMLWFPEAAAHLVPGWFFNLATIVHSDEALLATGFIFTVHFFNTHFRPEKFPMDTVIFDGRISEEELREERPEQWKRLQAEGRLGELVMEAPPSLVWAISYRVFGFTAVALGLSLAAAMAYALLSNG
jgi:cytochrome b subunit of formate dehydrogenase